MPPGADNVTIVGTPYSTFTRTITMALLLKGVPFTQLDVMPGSSEAKQHHPFGTGQIPVYVEGELDDRDAYKLTESLAILQLLDRKHAEAPPLLSPPEHEHGVHRVTEAYTFVAGVVFAKVEAGVVKPLVAAKEDGRQVDVASGLDELRETFRALEKVRASGTTKQAGSFFLGTTQPTAVDLLLYPQLADLRATKEGRALLQDFQPFVQWMEVMDTLPCVRETSKGTVADKLATAAL